MRRFSLRQAAAYVAAGSLAIAGVYNGTALGSERNGLESVKKRIQMSDGIVPPRDVQESALRGSSPSSPFDILVIGGGATGCGVALDAAARGLRVGLVERDDFSAGTSSRSTKLVHGGVRYLEKAVFNFDYGQLKLVFHALEERDRIIKNAPHLCNALPTMTPCYDWFEVLYFWAGLKLYDLVAGPRMLHLSRYCSAQESFELFPTLAKKGHGRSLKGTVVYYDGQMNDSRLNVGLACTAALAGAAVLNHAEAISLHKDELSARVRNNLTGKEFDIYAKVVVNAAGPFCDEVRKMADINAQQMICPSSGVHIVLPDYYSPEEDAVNTAIKVGNLSPSNDCVTAHLRIVGGDEWDPASFTSIAQKYIRMKKTHGGKIVPGAMDTTVAKHLSHAYGSMNENLGKRLAHGYSFLEAEVAYCARNEYCESAVDFLARRSRLAFLDTDAAGRALPRIIELLAAEHGWDKARKKTEMANAKAFLETFKSSQNAQFDDGKHKPSKPLIFSLKIW